MTRYFFHIEDGEPIWDREGQLHADDSAAYASALTKAPDLLRAAFARSRPPGEDWRLEILDETGRMVGSLHFQGCLAPQ
jgi:hypothetical protein